MRNLFNLIIKNIHWLLFVLLMGASVFMIVNNNAFQRSKYLTLEKDIIGCVYSVSSYATSYVGLKSINEDLLKKNIELESRVLALEQALKSMQDTVTYSIAGIRDSASYEAYSFMSARVVNNSISKKENYITLNKGAKDGVTADMGVISTQGVVGLVILASDHFSLVMPILNTKFRLSCKVKTNNYFGSLVWDSKDPRYAYLEELPRHALFTVGDTVVTSGYSNVFPEGFEIGTVVDAQKQKNDNFNSLKVLLSTDFGSLSDALIIKSRDKQEQAKLEREISTNDN